MTNEEQTRPVPVAIIGIGCLFPKADNVESYWANLQDGVDAIGEVPATHWRPEDYFDKDPKRPDFTYAARGGFLSPVDFPALELGISPNVLEATDSTQLLGLLAAKQALEVAGYGAAGKAFDRNKVSVILGVTGTLELVIPLGARLGHPHWKRALKEAGVEDSVAADVVQRIADSYVGWQEDSFPGLLGNVVAGRIANRLDLGGTNCVVDAACASSLSAMHLALLELAAGRSDMAIAGGMDTFNDIFMYMCFSKTPALSPTGDSRPFDTKADGTILGEGLGCVLLKRLADAERDGDTIYAVIRSIGTSSDGKGQAIYAPAPKGQAKALRQAYRLAGVTPESIELVEAHGTGTRAGDAAEVTALNEVYRNGVDPPKPKGERSEPLGSAPPNPWCAIGSVKSQIGHTKAAAGIAGLIKATLALYHKVLPPTIKVAQPIEQFSPDRSPFYVNTEKRPWMLSRTGHPRRAAVSAFGFGGSNFHCVLEEHGSQKPSVDWDANVQILAFSAQLSEELRQRLVSWPGDLAWDDLRIEAARCRARFFSKHRYRLTIVVERGKKDAGQLVASAIAKLDQSLDQDAWTTPDGIYFCRRTAPGKLALIFPGQGSQYVGMLRDLACRWPMVQASLIEANAMFARHRSAGDHRLSDFIYPQSAFREEDRQRNEDALRATDVAQPALGALSIGALRVFEHFHVQPDAVAGHSYGELTALCAAGWIDAPSLHMLSHLRGRLMASGVGDRGGMLAVRAPLATVEAIVKDECLDLVLANRNAPNQAVLSGSSLEIERAREVFGNRKIDCRLLPVAAAFHSSFVADARKPFLEALEKIAVHSSATPVFANTTGQEYPRDPKAIRDLLAGQLAEPVRFVEEIENLYRFGVRTFIEVGPSNKLSGLIDAILEGRPHDVFALDASNGKRAGFADLARVLAPLAALGHRVELGLWDEGHAEKQTKAEKKPTLTVPICGANYVKPKEARPAKPLAAKPQAAAPPAPVKPSQSTPVPRVQEARSAMAKPMNEPVPSVPAETGGMRQTLAMTQENLLALQKLAEQTAQLHRQFLEGQDRTLQVFQSLLEQQNSLMSGRQAAPVRVVESVPAPIVSTPRQVSVAPAPKAPVAKPAIPVQPVAAPMVAQAPSPVANGRMQSTLLDVVAAKTGYPAEMLQLDMELDTDLGIDSIKRVEIFALLQEKLPEAPLVKAEHLGTLRTLRHVVEFLGESRILPSPAGRGAGGEGETVVPPSASVGQDSNPVTARQDWNPVPQFTSPNSDEATSVFLDVVAQKTGYPPEMLQLDMELDTDLGIDSIKRVEIFALLQEKLPEAPPVKAEHLGTLRTLRHVVEFLGESSVLPPPSGRGAGGVGETVVPLSASVGQDSNPVTARQDWNPVPQFTSPSSDEATSVFLDVVAQKTGYPPEMLQLDMELDTDLGIDSIKRVEIFSLLQEKLPDAPTVKAEHLGTLRTIRHVIDFIAAPPHNNGTAPTKPHDERSDSWGSAPERPLTPNPSPPEYRGRGEQIQRLIVAPIELDEQLPRDSVALPANGEIWINGDDSELALSVSRRLELLGYRSRIVALSEANKPSELAGLILIAPSNSTNDAFLRDAFHLLQSAAAGLRTSGKNGGAVFATVSRVDGAFGLSGISAGDPLTGGLAGMSKTASHEWPDVHCKAIDLASDWTDLDEAAFAIVEEMLLRGPLEVGLSPAHRCALQLTPTPQSESLATAPLNQGDVVIITGGARGVTAETAIALAKAFAPTLVLLGRSPLPSAEPAWLAPLTQENDIKRALMAQINGQASPKEIGEHYRGIAANREMLATLERIRQAGARGVYRQVDVRDANAVRAVVSEIRQEFGPIKGLVHGAGVLADRRIEDKTREQFDMVYATKVVGLQALLDAFSDDDLRVLALFSSSTARFGRTGQVDYAVANEVLNKLAQREALRRPHCKVVSFNWGPWDGGMVNASLKKVFEGEGVGTIPLQGGADFFVREICQPIDRPVEVVVLGTLGDAPAAIGVADAVAFEREVSVASMPVLRSHVIKGHPVLPMALIVEWLAHGALHANPGLAFHGFDQLQILKGVILHDEQPLQVRVLTGKAAKNENLYRIPVELRSIAHGRGTLHARAEIVLANKLPASDAKTHALTGPAYPRSKADVYDEYLFHGPELHGIEQIETCAEAGIAATVASAPLPIEWIAQPLRGNWLTDPLVLDCAFQLMIVWSQEQHGAGSLPTSVGRYRQHQRAFPKDGVRIIARVTKQSEHRAVADIDFVDRAGKLVARMTDYECVIDRSLNEAFRGNQLSL